MMSPFRFYSHIFAIVVFSYITVGYPVAGQLLTFEPHENHEHRCQCGCNGDIARCTCEATSGIVGFRYCDSPKATLIPLLPLWSASQWKSSGNNLKRMTGKNLLPYLNNLIPQDVINNPDHPPQQIPVKMVLHI